MRERNLTQLESSFVSILLRHVSSNARTRSLSNMFLKLLDVPSSALINFGNEKFVFYLIARYFF